MPEFGTEDRMRLEIATRQRYLRVIARRITQRRSNQPTKAERDTIKRLKDEIATLKEGKPV